MRTLALLCLLFTLPLQQQTKPEDTSPKRCTVTEVVREGIRSDCGAWRPAKTEKIFMPTEVSKRLKVGDVFYFVWKETRWVAEIPAEEPDTVALVFGPDPIRIEIMKTEEAENLYQKLKIDLLLTMEPKEEDVKTFAALTLALDRVPRLEDQRKRLDWEIRRGVRPPLQKPEPKEVIHVH